MPRTYLKSTPLSGQALHLVKSKEIEHKQHSRMHLWLISGNMGNLIKLGTWEQDWLTWLNLMAPLGPALSVQDPQGQNDPAQVCFLSSINKETFWNINHWSCYIFTLGLDRSCHYDGQEVINRIVTEKTLLFPIFLKYKLKNLRTGRKVDFTKSTEAKVPRNWCHLTNFCLFFF